jgi:hypothetical protein
MKTRTLELKRKNVYTFFLKSAKHNTSTVVEVNGLWVIPLVQFADTCGLQVYYGTRRLTIEQAEMIVILKEEQ